MSKSNKSQLKFLHKASDIQYIWNAAQSLKVINHPEHDWISPNKYRALSKGKPCPYCGKKMVHGKEFHSTISKLVAIQKGYEYTNKSGKKVINNINETIFFHPNYLTLDHKINKARCPEKMFDYDNLEAVCWKCNREKGDNNSFKIQHIQQYLDSLADEALARYPVKAERSFREIPREGLDIIGKVDNENLYLFEDNDNKVLKRVLVGERPGKPVTIGALAKFCPYSNIILNDD